MFEAGEEEFNVAGLCFLSLIKVKTSGEAQSLGTIITIHTCYQPNLSHKNKSNSLSAATKHYWQVAGLR